MMKLTEKILQLKKQKNAVLLAHYYVDGQLQDIADFVGDSLQLSQEASKTNAEIIVFIGVYFMAETAKIISPSKKVLIPDVEAKCSLADSCNAQEFAEFLKQYPNHTVISYVNTSAEVKALSHYICTSSNAVKLVESLPQNEKIVFAPDKNLGNYINSQTNREMILWDGACHVHQEFSLEKILQIKRENPEALLLSHPECKKPILLISDFIGSTTALLNFSQKSKATKFIVATESGILHQMKKSCPEKTFIPAPPEGECACNECNFMKINTLEKVYRCLETEKPEINLSTEIIEKAILPIRRMLNF